jgi:hypothetical protein
LHRWIPSPPELGSRLFRYEIEDAFFAAEHLVDRESLGTCAFPSSD